MSSEFSGTTPKTLNPQQVPFSPVAQEQPAGPAGDLLLDCFQRCRRRLESVNTPRAHVSVLRTLHGQLRPTVKEPGHVPQPLQGGVNSLAQLFVFRWQGVFLIFL